MGLYAGLGTSYTACHSKRLVLLNSMVRFGSGSAPVPGLFLDCICMSSSKSDHVCGRTSTRHALTYLVLRYNTYGYAP